MDYVGCYLMYNLVGSYILLSNNAACHNVKMSAWKSKKQDPNKSKNEKRHAPLVRPCRKKGGRKDVNTGIDTMRNWMDVGILCDHVRDVWQLDPFCPIRQRPGVKI